jgi:hypothetical protein
MKNRGINKKMEELIRNYTGVTLTIGITGLPILITGEVAYVNNGIAAVRLEDKRTVYVNTAYIAFFN